MAKLNYSQLNQMNEASEGGRVRFFSLKNDGDEAVVRIMHDSSADYDIVAVHTVNAGGRYRDINCLREVGQPVTSCPFCAAQVRSAQKFYVHMIQYVKDESGTIIPVPTVWARSALSMSQKLNTLIEEYGPLSNCIFKIKRQGKAGDMHTKYEINYANPTIYREDLYPKVPEAFANYDVLKHAVYNKSASDMEQFIATGDFPVGNNANSPSYSSQSASAQIDMIVDDEPSYNPPVAEPPSTGVPAYSVPTPPSFTGTPAYTPTTTPTNPQPPAPSVQRPVRYY